MKIDVLQPNGESPLVMSGRTVVGEHGTEFAPPAKPQDFYTAILDCGREVQFRQPPRSEEQLWCSFHQLWEGCKVIGGYLIKCDNCAYNRSLGHDYTSVYNKAYCHVKGKTGVGRPTEHHVKIGRYTATGIDWKDYK